MKKIVAIFGLLSILSTTGSACDLQQATNAVKIALKETAKSAGAQSVTLSAPTNLYQQSNPELVTFVFRLEKDSALNSSFGLIGFDMKKCDIGGTLLLPAVQDVIKTN